MIRLYEPQPLSIGQRIILGERAHHYLCNVLRIKSNEQMTLFNGQGGEYQGEIIDISKKQVTVAITAFNDREVESPIAIHLAQGMPKADKLDYIVQKAVELGVASITPVVAERSQGRLSNEQAQKKTTRLSEIVINACEQCGRNRVPNIYSPQLFAEWLNTTKQHQHRFVLSAHHAKPLQVESIAPHESILLLVGPEGGLTSYELAEAEAAGFIPLRFGERILRTETASIAALSVLQWCFGDFRELHFNSFPV